MALATYSDLKTSIANWLNRSDLTDHIPDFIALAEARFNREIRTPEMETTDTITVDGETEALPADCLGIRSLWVEQSPDIPLDYFPPQHLRAIRASATTGQPTSYTVIGSNIVLAPTPVSSYTLGIAYYQKIPALSDAATTNWLLTNHPDLYLAASLAAAELFIWNDERLPMWVSMASGIIETINESGEKKRRGSAPLIARGTTAIS